MPRTRTARPFRPKPTAADIERERAVSAEIWRHALCEAWTKLVHEESWRLTYAEGRRACGRVEFERGARSLIEQGVIPPNGWKSLL